MSFFVFQRQKRRPLNRVFFVLTVCFTAFGAGGEESAGYKYTLRNYFSKRSANEAPPGEFVRHIQLYVGSDFYRETAQKKLRPFSSLSVGLSQRVRDLAPYGDIHLRVELRSMKLAAGREQLVSVIPVLSLPDARSLFPVYVGAGAGAGVFPRHLVKQKSILSLTGLLFGGFRAVDWYKNMGAFAEISTQFHLPFSEMKLSLEVFVTFGCIFSF